MIIEEKWRLGGHEEDQDSWCWIGYWKVAMDSLKKTPSSEWSGFAFWQC